MTPDDCKTLSKSHDELQFMMRDIKDLCHKHGMEYRYGTHEMLMEFLTGVLTRDAEVRQMNDLVDPLKEKDREIDALKRELESWKRLLVEIDTVKDQAYRERNKLVAALTHLFPCSLEQHDGRDWENDWRWVVYIDLPAQVSWHIHDSELPLFDHVPRLQGAKWDGHTTEEKYRRLLDTDKWEVIPT